MLTGLVLAACTALFLSRNWMRPRRADHLAHVWLLLDAGRLDEAMAALDALGRRQLSADEMIAWLQLRVLALGLAGECDEALEVAEGLEELDDGDPGLRLVTVGNRAIALLHADRFAEAEPLLDETERLAGTLRGAGHAASADANLAETWWWRAEIARRRGDDARRRDCLGRAAGLGAFHFAARAREALGGYNVAAT